jgi:hypothetical protein
MVLGLMIVCLVAQSAAGRPILSCRLSAACDLSPRVVIPGKPDIADTKPLVAGTCTFPTPGFSVELKPHTPASPDPKILVLDAIVHTPTIPTRHGPTDVPVGYGSPYVRSKTGILYEKIIVLPDNLVLTVAKLS